MGTPRLRVAHVVVQPVVVWDNGDELSPGPQMHSITLPLSALRDLPDRLVAELAARQAEILAADQRQA